MTKTQLIQLAAGTTSGIDTAIPIDWSDKLRDLGFDNPAAWFAFDHRTSCFGEPLFLGDAVMDVIHRAMAALMEDCDDTTRISNAYSILDGSLPDVN